MPSHWDFEDFEGFEVEPAAETQDGVEPTRAGYYLFLTITILNALMVLFWMRFSGPLAVVAGGVAFLSMVVSAAFGWAEAYEYDAAVMKINDDENQ